MFLIEYIIKHSPNRGLGIYARQNIKKKTLIWDLNRSKSMIFNNKYQFKNYLKTYNDDEKRNIIEKTFITDKKIIYTKDDMQYMNHNRDNPNCFIKNGSSYALRDINIGEELFEDYSKYEDNMNKWYIKLLEEHNIWKEYILCSSNNNIKFTSFMKFKISYRACIRTTFYSL